MVASRARRSLEIILAVRCPDRRSSERHQRSSMLEVGIRVHSMRVNAVMLCALRTKRLPLMSRHGQRTTSRARLCAIGDNGGTKVISPVEATTSQGAVCQLWASSLRAKL
jgi:hypothetical protein